MKKHETFKFLMMGIRWLINDTRHCLFANPFDEGTKTSSVIAYFLSFAIRQTIKVNMVFRKICPYGSIRHLFSSPACNPGLVSWYPLGSGAVLVSFDATDRSILLFLPHSFSKNREPVFGKCSGEIKMEAITPQHDP